MRKALVSAAAVAAILLPSLEAKASRCGSMRNARWNAPPGSAVVTRTEGEVANTFDAVGRYWTHIVVSDGNNGIFESHRGFPMKADEFQAALDLPLEPGHLRAGGPGPSHTNMSGATASMAGITSGNDAVTGRRDYDAALYFPGTSQVSNVLSFLQGMMPMHSAQVHETNGVYSGLDRLIFTYVTPAGVTATSVLPYNFLNFRATLGSEAGIVDARGFACSNFLAFAANRALGVTIPAETISVDDALHGLKNLRDATEQACHVMMNDPSTPAIERDVANLTNGCGRAGEQVANCLSGVNNYSCANRGDEWQNPNNWYGGSGPVHVLTPDRIVNWGAATTLSASPWLQQRAGASGREVTWSVDTTSPATFGCWGGPDDQGSDDGSVASGPDGAQAPQNATTGMCGDVVVNVPETNVRVYHRTASGGDSEMGGDHPIINASAVLRQEGDVIVADNKVSMVEGGGDHSTFVHGGYPSAYTRPVYAAPDGCVISSFTPSGGTSGAVSVADAGWNNHAETTYAGTGAVTNVACLSDVDGDDNDALYCKVRLRPITVHLSPRFVFVNPIPLPPIPIHFP